MAPRDIVFDIMGGYSKEEYVEFDPQETVNMFQVNAVGGKKALFPSPGLSLENGIDFVQSPGARGRAVYVFNDHMFVIVGEAVYRCTKSGETLDHALIGAINTETGYVGIANLDNQLMFVDGVDGWIWKPDTSTFSQISFGFDIEPVDVMVSGNRFIALNKDTKQWYYSNFGTGLIWNVLNINTFNNGDTCVACETLKGRLYLMGEVSTEIWYDAGAPIDPYRPADPAIQIGCASPGSVATDFGILVWLSKTNSGVGSVVATTGGQPSPISDQAVDTAIDAIGDVSDASGYLYMVIYIRTKMVIQCIE
jgi:hypothetical protein